MSQKFAVCTTYSCSSQTEISLPEGQVWDDIEDWYVKWDAIWIKFKYKQNYLEYPLETDAIENIDWKRPTRTEVFVINEDGQADYDKKVGEHE